MKREYKTFTVNNGLSVTLTSIRPADSRDKFHMYFKLKGYITIGDNYRHKFEYWHRIQCGEFGDRKECKHFTNKESHRIYSSFSHDPKYAQDILANQFQPIWNAYVKNNK